MKKERNRRPRKNYHNKKKKNKNKAITIVVFMSKGSYRKVLEGMNLTAENDYFIFTEQWKNNRIQIFPNEFGKILFTRYTPVIKEYSVSV